MFSGSNASKYPTIGKFLPQTSNTQVVFPGPQEKNADENLDTLDQLITQTLISRNDSVQTGQDSPQVSSRAKEVLPNQAQASAENAATEEVSKQIESISPVESAPNPEMAELSKELQEVSKETKEQREQAMIAEKQKEINNLAATVTSPVAISDKPVVVLPITVKSKEEAKFKSTKYSVKWLLEWCEKVAKMFSGAVVYKEEVSEDAQ
jgi:hypothetical protein